MKHSLVILLHGVGSHGLNLAPLGDVWRENLPTTRFAAPDAPAPFDMGPGYQWFSIDGVTPDNRPQRVQGARADFDRLIGGLLSEQGLIGHPERVVLAGFSQGSIMALDAVASGRWQFAAVVAFSGRLSSPQPLTPAVGTPVLLLHGADDPVIPSWETERAAAALQALGLTVQFAVLPQLGHGISPEGVTLAGQFIAHALAATGD